MKTKRFLAVVLAVLMIAASFASCRTKDENAYTFTYGDKTINIRTSLYMCFLIDADLAFQDKAVAAADKAGTKYEEYQELKYEDKNYETWTKDEAKKSAEKYAYAEIEFDRLGYSLSDEEESYIKYYAESQWEGNESAAGVGEVYEANGVSYNTYLDYFTNSYWKQEMVYTFYIEEPESEDEHDHDHEETTTAEGETAAETTTEKKLDPEIEKLHGSMRPEDKQINSALSDNFVPVYMIDVGFTDEEGNEKDDATKKSQLKLLNDYAKQLNKGTDFEKVYSTYTQAFGASTEDTSSSSSAADYEKVLLSAKANENANGENEADENFEEALKMKAGEAKVIENEECYILILRRNILKDKDSSDSEYTESYTSSAISVLVKNDYDTNVVEAFIKEMKCNTNSSAVEFYSPDKIDYLNETTTAAMSTEYAE